MQKIIHTKIKPLFIIISIIATRLFLSSPVSALSHSDGTSVQFTFNPALSINVSGDLIIEDLAPGYASDSNIITIDVNTNNKTGYNLYATVGNTTAYNNTDLNFTNGSFQNDAPKFTSLATTDNVSELSNLSNDTWGYSYSTDNGITWAGYSGLPLYTNEGIVINNSTSASRTTTNFKIAARAAFTQTSGDYSNVINFIIIANRPLVSFYDAFTSAGKTKYEDYFRMQDMTTDICREVEIIGQDSQTKLIDIRDNNTYWVAKLADGNCWMTQNLDFAPLVTETYTHYDTDLGWTTGNASATWQPSSTLANPAGITDFAQDGVIVGWVDNANLPYYAEGKYYTAGAFTDDEIIVINGAKHQGISACINTSHTQTECEHYQVGNYYNWAAAIASNDASNITAKYAVAENSVCPAGWRLPKGLTSSGGTITQSEYNFLLSAAGIANGTDLTGVVNVGYTTNGWLLMTSDPYYFVQGGSVAANGMGFFATAGSYGSSTATNDRRAYSTLYNSSLLYPADEGWRHAGRSLRCLAR